jgi:hypothetical protein
VQDPPRNVEAVAWISSVGLHGLPPSALRTDTRDSTPPGDRSRLRRGPRPHRQAGPLQLGQDDDVARSAARPEPMPDYLAKSQQIPRGRRLRGAAADAPDQWRVGSARHESPGPSARGSFHPRGLAQLEGVGQVPLPAVIPARDEAAAPSLGGRGGLASGETRG